jgi:uncharacterized repeat protein (TIGR03843 family)
VSEGPEAALELLGSGAIEVIGLLPHSSNYTFLVRVVADEGETLGVYKPRRGEQPLWDFPSGTLAAREVAAYLVARATGWDLVPPTLLREDAPLGPGSLQLFIEHDPERHYLVLMEERGADLARFAAYDVVINNADRKSGHVLEGDDGRLWAVDHGVTFHTEPKLRTVIWDYAEQPLPESVVTGLRKLEEELSGATLPLLLRELLSEEEVHATLARAKGLLQFGRFPAPASDRPFPWPLV